MAIAEPINPNEIVILSDGTYLSQSALARMDEASKETPIRIVERRVSVMDSKEIESLGLRATPSIFF
jgi:hypothetical protein